MDKRNLALRLMLKTKTALEDAGEYEYAQQVGEMRDKYQRETTPLNERETLLRLLFGNKRASELTVEEKRIYHRELQKVRLAKVKVKPTLAEEIFGKRYSDLNDEEKKAYQRERNRRIKDGKDEI